MGKVFSWDEIERKAVPQLADFSVVMDKIRKDLEATDGIIGGIFCGSILWNSCNQRSDIDCVIVYDPLKQREAVETFQGINQTAAILHVPVELIPLDLEVIRTPLHHIGLSFAIHLRYATQHGGLIKENPLPLFVFEGASPLEDVRGYLRNKMQRLEKGMSVLPVMEVAELHRFLQKVLEAPIHVARKMLWWQKVKTPDDSKETVLRYYPEIANGLEHELFAKITAADRGYTAELLAQLQSPSRDQYSQAIEEIKNLAWDTLKFVKLNAFHFV